MARRGRDGGSMAVRGGLFCGAFVAWRGLFDMELVREWFGNHATITRQSRDNHAMPVRCWFEGGSKVVRR